MVGGVRVGHERAEAQPATVELDHVVQVEPVDVDNAGGPLDVLLHQVDEVGAARQVAGIVAGAVTERLGEAAGTGIVEAVHRAASAWSTSITASVMLV